jgi:predicted RNase H-like HicB family nuclease
MRYIALLHQDPGSEISVSFPDPPGCVTTASTLAKVRQLAEEALLGHLVAMGAAGLPMPEPSTLAAITEHEDYKDSLALMLLEVPSESSTAA